MWDYKLFTHKETDNYWFLIQESPSVGTTTEIQSKIDKMGLKTYQTTIINYNIPGIITIGDEYTGFSFNCSSVCLAGTINGSSTCSAK
jgi:hypothetical protein